MNSLLAYFSDKSFPRFLTVGGIGFVFEAVVLSITTWLFGANPLLARLGSFSAAVVLTWAINRSWSFSPSARPKLVEFCRYVAVQVAGGVINLFIYAATLHFLEGPAAPLVGLANGSAVAALFNYFGARTLAFGTFEQTEDDQPDQAGNWR